MGERGFHGSNDSRVIEVAKTCHSSYALTTINNTNKEIKMRWHIEKSVAGRGSDGTIFERISKARKDMHYLSVM